MTRRDSDVKFKPKVITYPPKHTGTTLAPPQIVFARVECGVCAKVIEYEYPYSIANVDRLCRDMKADSDVHEAGCGRPLIVRIVPTTRPA